jgi:hypothetical protein
LYSEHQRNLSACKEGREICDYTRLTSSETQMLADAEHKRNYAACFKGSGYCDVTRLTPAEANSIPPGQKP